MPIAREKAHRALITFLLWGFISELLFASERVGYMGDTIPVIWYIGVLLGSQFLKRKTIRYGLLTMVVLTLIKWEYYPHISWSDPFYFVSSLYSDLAYAFHCIVTGQIQQINDGVRTLAFFGVITFGTKLLEECIYRPYWLLTALGAGEYTLLSISLSYGVNDYFEMILFLLTGFSLLILMNIPKLQLFSSGLARKELLRHLAAPMGLIAVMILSGLAMPKPVGTWPKPHQWLLYLEHKTSATQESYGAHDSQLGGPFQGSNQVFLRVFANQPSYYRGEIKDTYTGRGWINTAAPTVSIKSGKAIPKRTLGQTGVVSSTPVSRFTERIQVVHHQYPVLFGGYQIQKVVLPSSQKSYTVNTENGAISAGMLTPGETYTVTTAEPIPTAAELSRVNDANVAYAFAADLQLPKDFPQRDRALALRITAGKTGTYAKVEAIIRYLQSHETYDTKNIPYISPGQDFVDQFLFVTHRGYCDHFSSALAVLSRVVGIPSRWVQGFVTVPANPAYHGRTNEYVLRGTDAHSWAEIWFAGYGWIPMEATPSFVLPMQKQAQTQTAERIAHQRHAQKQPVAHHQTRTNKTANSIAAFFSQLGHPVRWLVLTLELAVILCILGVLSWWWTRRLQRQKHVEQSPDLKASVLLGQFLHLFGRKRPDQTLREYVLTVDDVRTRAEMMRFVVWYEHLRYGRDHSPESVQEGTAVLRNLSRLFKKRGVFHKKTALSPTTPMGSVHHIFRGDR